nr:ExeM/NucH family extracellular endonuclease [Sansalvadorimonas sp. 2012CJ34-2]
MASAELIFSEYVEGSGNDNKAFEIYNNGSSNIQLSDYKIVKFTDGDQSKGYALEFTGADGLLAPEETFVVAVSNKVDGVYPSKIHQVANFNGDDSLQIQRLNGTVVDTLGEFGDVDFGKDKVLSRKTTGLVASTAFRSDQWDAKSKTSVFGFGFKPGEEYVIPPFVSCVDADRRISSVQGTGNIAVEKRYVQLKGVVTRTLYKQYFIEQERTSADSEGASVAIRVYDSVNKPEVGDEVTVQGWVVEYSDVTQLKDIKSGKFLKCSSGQSVPQTSISMPENGNYEPYESMNVVLSPMTGDGNSDGVSDDGFYVSDVYGVNRYADLVVSSGGNLIKPTNKYPAASAEAKEQQEKNNKNKIVIDDGDSRSYLSKVNYLPDLDFNNPVRVGDRIDSGMQGIISQGFGSYRLVPAGKITLDSSSNPRVANPASPAAGILRVASFNVLNYFNGFRNGDGTIDWAKSDKGNSRGANTAAEFGRQSSKIAVAMARMEADIVGVLEMENDGWGEYSAIQNLVNQLNASSDKPQGKNYDFVRSSDQFIGNDVIKVSIIYDKNSVETVGQPTILKAYPFDEVTGKHRPPMVQTFKQKNTDKELTVVINHFKSKGSDCDDLADKEDTFGQGNCNRQRVSAAETLGKFLQANHVNKDVLLIGDLNAYAKEDPVLVLTRDDTGRTIEKSVRASDGTYAVETTDYHLGYSNLGGNNPVSYVYKSESGALDHALASPSLKAKVEQVSDWAINSRELPGMDYNDEFYRDYKGKEPTEYKASASGQQDEWFDKYVTQGESSPFRSSDHDPVLIDLDLTKTEPGEEGVNSGDGGGSFGFPMLSLGLLSLLGLRRRKMS